jgi:hypothetical protein
LGVYAILAGIRPGGGLGETARFCVSRLRSMCLSRSRLTPTLYPRRRFENIYQRFEKQAACTVVAGGLNRYCASSSASPSSGWIPGVNQLKTYGRWAFAEFTDVYEIESDFAAKVARRFGEMIVRVAQP